MGGENHLVAKKRLVVMRHAKAEPYAETDAERELTPRGHEAAEAAGRHLAALQTVPDHALVSSAVRTRQTWQAVREGSGSAATEEISEQLYAASPAAVLETLRLVPEETETCLFVGHNPTAAHLAAELDDGEADPEVLRGLLGGFPTCAMAVFEVGGAWSELGEAGARLIHFYPGRP
jgi:phosphohistidine phosphatase